MASKNNNYYKKQRVKTKKVKEQIKERQAPTSVNRFEGDRKRKTIISVIAIGMVLLMLASLIIPYIGRVSNRNFTLPETALTAGTNVTEQAYNPQTITVNQILDRPDQTYYVLVGPASTISQFQNQIIGSVYTVDTGLFENRNIQTGESNALPTNIDQLEFNQIAILKVENGHITGFANGSDQVQEFIDHIE